MRDLNTVPETTTPNSGKVGGMRPGAAEKRKSWDEENNDERVAGGGGAGGEIGKGVGGGVGGLSRYMFSGEVVRIREVL